MSPMQWEVELRRVDCDGKSEIVRLGKLRRPEASRAKPADFGISLAEARGLLGVLQQAVIQQQVLAYDAAKRECPHCGRYRRIKDWRSRVFDTALGVVRVRVPRVVACMCLPEALDENGDIAPFRESLCPIAKLLPARVTPEVSYLCARDGAQMPYRSAAKHIRELCGIPRMSHMRVRRQMMGVGQEIEDRAFEAGWLAGARTPRSADRLGLVIDSTVVPGNAFEETTKIEVVAGRIIQDGHCGRRFACVTMRRSLTRMLVAGALKNSGWHAGTEVDVVNDGAKGMRSLVTDVAPNVATPMLDWFHLAMKLHAVKTSLFASTFEPAPAIIQRCRRLWTTIRDALWRGRAALGIELARTLEASLAEAAPLTRPFYASTAATAEGATLRLREFLENNASILVDYGKARQRGRRISTAPAESVMNHVVNRRMSKRQQMRWSVKGAHLLLQTRVSLVDGCLLGHFKVHHPHFRSPEFSTGA